MFCHWGWIKPILLFSDDGTGRVDGGESKLEEEIIPTTSKQESMRERYKIATALPPNFNHQPNLKGFLLHEALLRKNFEGDQQFFRDSGHMEAHPTSPRPSYIEPGDQVGATRAVHHEDAPAFSDIATTVMTTVSPTSPGKLLSIDQNRPSKKRIESKGGQVVTATSPSRTGQQRDSPKAEQYPKLDFTKKGPRPVGKSFMDNPTDMGGDTTITSIIHTTTVISTMREQGMYVHTCWPS